MKHYVYGSGTHGCLYDYGPNVALTPKDAVESLAQVFELGKVRKARLARELYLELNHRRDGAEYCEISECNCSTPWDHCENAKKGGRPKKTTTQEDWSTPEGRQKVYRSYDWIDKGGK